jgi:hypothetical protein
MTKRVTDEAPNSVCDIIEKTEGIGKSAVGLALHILAETAP